MGLWRYLRRPDAGVAAAEPKQSETEGKGQVVQIVQAPLPKVNSHRGLPLAAPPISTLFGQPQDVRCSDQAG